MPAEAAPELPEPLTLRLWQDGEVLFSSASHWLHPLFELEAFLAGGGRDPGRCRLEDRITGRGAAFLVVRLGLRDLHSGLLSDRAVPVLERWGVRTRAGARVPRVLCATEDLLAGIEDPEAAWALLRERRDRAQERAGQRPGQPLRT